MGLFEPLNCCCCMDLKTGSIILGALSVIFSSISVLCTLKEAITNNQYMQLQEFFTLDEQHGGICGHDFDCSSMLAYLNQLYVPCIVVAFIFAFIDLTFGALLIHGVKKEKPTLLLPYMVKMIIVIVIVVACMFIPFFVYPDPTVLGVSVVMCLLITIVPVYYVLVIRATYLQIRRQQGEIPTELINTKDKDYLITA